ncbi:MAG: hypothetical protein M1820_000233 [Bogoriella megaspora]|nr:MAG: hypothetical protein M1820_000233 [Bogoriella megaspora]
MDDEDVIPKAPPSNWYLNDRLTSYKGKTHMSKADICGALQISFRDWFKLRDDVVELLDDFADASSGKVDLRSLWNGDRGPEMKISMTMRLIKAHPHIFDSTERYEVEPPNFFGETRIKLGTMVFSEAQRARSLQIKVSKKKEENNKKAAADRSASPSTSIFGDVSQLHAPSADTPIAYNPPAYTPTALLVRKPLFPQPQQSARVQQGNNNPGNIALNSFNFTNDGCFMMNNVVLHVCFDGGWKMKILPAEIRKSDDSMAVPQCCDDVSFVKLQSLLSERYFQGGEIEISWKDPDGTQRRLPIKTDKELTVALVKYMQAYTTGTLKRSFLGVRAARTDSDIEELDDADDGEPVQEPPKKKRKGGRPPMPKASTELPSKPRQSTSRTSVGESVSVKVDIDDSEDN